MLCSSCCQVSQWHANDHAPGERPCKCNLIGAVYIAMQGGKLLCFDKNAGSRIKTEDLVELGYNSVEAQRARRSWVRFAGPDGHRAAQSY
jgi:hypothetical protein